MGKHEDNMANHEELMAANKEVIISKATQFDTQISQQQVIISKKKAKEIKRTNIPKEIKTRAEDTNGYIRTEEKEDVSAHRAQ